MNVARFTNLRRGRVNLGEAKRILNQNGNAYSDEEVKKIVDYLYALAELEVEHVEKQSRKNLDRSEQR